MLLCSGRIRLTRKQRSAHHHIVSDAWSSGILVREVAVLYDAYMRGEASPLDSLLCHDEGCSKAVLKLSLRFANILLQAMALLGGEMEDYKIKENC